MQRRSGRQRSCIVSYVGCHHCHLKGTNIITRNPVQQAVVQNKISKFIADCPEKLRYTSYYHRTLGKICGYNPCCIDFFIKWNKLLDTTARTIGIIRGETSWRKPLVVSQLDRKYENIIRAEFEQAKLIIKETENV